MSEIIDEALVKLGIQNDLTGPLARAVAEAKAEIEDLGRTKAKIKIDDNVEEEKAKLAALKAELKSLNDQRAKPNNYPSQNKALDDEIARVKALTAAQEQQLRSRQAVQSKVNSINKMATSIEKDYASAQRDSTKAANDRAKAENLAATATLRRAQQLKRATDLQDRYTKAQDNYNKLQKAYSRAQGSDKIRVELDASRALADMEVLREELKLMGRDPIEIKAKVDSGSALKDFAKIFNFGGKSGIGGDSTMIRSIGQEIKSLGSSLKGARVNIAGVSTSLYGLLGAAAVLSPVLVGLVGTTGALVGAVGSAATGALGVGAAAMTGFGLATVGVVAAVKPFVSQISAARAAQKNYNTEVAKYGASSTEAKTALKEYNNTLASLSPQSRQAVKDMHNLGVEWKNATGTVAKQDFGQVMSQTLQTAQKSMTWYSINTDKALDNVTKGWTGWMQQLRGHADQGALKNIFGNFDSSIRPVMSGLGSLGQAFLRITSAFSSHLPSLGKGFADWAKNIDQATSHTGRLKADVNEAVYSMQNLGHFAEQAGKFLANFFKAGIGPGNDLIESMTDGLHKLNDEMSTAAGQKKLTDFFSRSTSTVKSLWGALVPLVNIFVQFAHALAPISDVALQIAGAFAKVVGVFAGFKPIQLVAGIGLGLAVVSKLTAGLREAGKLMAGLVIAGGRFGAAFLSGQGLKSSIAAARSGGDAASLTAAAEDVNAQIVAGFAEGSSAAGAEIRAAMAGGGAEAAGEVAAAETAGGAASAAESVAPAAVAGAGGAAIAGESAVAAESTGAAEGLGAIAAALPEIALPAAAAVAGIAALVGGISLLGHSSQSVADQAKAAARDAQAVAKHSAVGAKTDQSGASGGLPAVSPGWKVGDQNAVNAAQAKYYALVRAGKSDSAAGRAALQQYNSALETQKQDLNANQGQIEKYKKIVEDATKYQGQDGVKAQQDLTKAQNDYAKSTKTVTADRKALADAQKSGNWQLEEEAQRKLNADLKDQTSTYRSLQTAQDAANKQQQAATERANASSAALLNLHRVEQGFIGTSQQSAQAVGGLVRSLLQAGPAGSRAITALTKIPDPHKVEALASGFSKLTSAADKKIAVNIIANDKDPIDAIRKINALQVKEKTLKLIAEASDALHKAAQVNGIKLTPKTLQLLGDARKAVAAHNQVQALADIKKVLTLNGIDTSALRAHTTVAALSNILKTLTISGNASGAQAAVSQAQAAINALPASRVVNIDVVTHTIHAKAIGGRTDIPTGISENPNLAATQVRAARTAAARPAQHTQGGVYASPTYLVGEENKPEYVIATNPAYRQQNIQYLKQAAGSFGLSVEGAAKGRKPPKPLTKAQERAIQSAARKEANKAYQAPKDQRSRIGGVGTGDITDAIGKMQQAISSAVGTIKTDHGNIKTDQNRIKQLNDEISANNTWNSKKAHKKDQHSNKEYITERNQYHDDMVRKNNEIVRLTAKENADKKRLGKFQKVLRQANTDIGNFTALETGISNAEAMMQAASEKDQRLAATGDAQYYPGGKFQEQTVRGLNGLNNKEEDHTFDEWQQIAEKLDAKHTALLQTAYDKAKKTLQGDSGKWVAGSQDFSYVQTLAAALGQSIEQEQADQGATDDTSGSSIDANVTPPTAEDISSFISGVDPTGAGIPGMTDLSNYVAELQYNLTNAQTGAQTHPGDPSYITAEQAAGQALLGFYQNTLMPEAQNWANPTFQPPSVDYSLLNDIAGAISDSQGTISDLQSSIAGPSQAQLASTALSTLYSQYGGNAAQVTLGGNGGGLLAAAMGMSPTDMTNAIMGGQAAEGVMANANAANIAQNVRLTAQAPPVAQAPATVQQGHTVINNFQEPPEDPHHWSKQIQWELSAMA